MESFHFLHRNAAGPAIALSTSFGAFWMWAFFAEVPRELTDAAAVKPPLRTFVASWACLGESTGSLGKAPQDRRR